MVPGNPKFDLLPADKKRRILKIHNKAAQEHNMLLLKNMQEAAKETKSNGKNVEEKESTDGTVLPSNLLWWYRAALNCHVTRQVLSTLPARYLPVTRHMQRLPARLLTYSPRVSMLPATLPATCNHVTGHATPCS